VLAWQAAWAFGSPPALLLRLSSTSCFARFAQGRATGWLYIEIFDRIVNEFRDIPDFLRGELRAFVEAPVRGQPGFVKIAHDVSVYSLVAKGVDALPQVFALRLSITDKLLDGGPVESGRSAQRARVLRNRCFAV